MNIDQIADKLSRKNALPDLYLDKPVSDVYSTNERINAEMYREDKNSDLFPVKIKFKESSKYRRNFALFIQDINSELERYNYEIGFLSTQEEPDLILALIYRGRTISNSCFLHSGYISQLDQLRKDNRYLTFHAGIIAKNLETRFNSKKDNPKLEFIFDEIRKLVPFN